ncbi:MAG TPA: hypothetical protein VGS17_01065 [Candidatus Limnocylindria bacterium]|nr:hypothetical protein [Candidatus Limnocylindria bacterium]
MDLGPILVALVAMAVAVAVAGDGDAARLLLRPGAGDSTGGRHDR